MNSFNIKSSEWVNNKTNIVFMEIIYNEMSQKKNFLNSTHKLKQIELSKMIYISFLHYYCYVVNNFFEHSLKEQTEKGWSVTSWNTL